MVMIPVLLNPYEVGAFTSFLRRFRWKDIFSARVGAWWRKKWNVDSQFSLQGPLFLLSVSSPAATPGLRPRLIPRRAR